MPRTSDHFEYAKCRLGSELQLLFLAGFEAVTFQPEHYQAACSLSIFHKAPDNAEYAKYSLRFGHYQHTRESKRPLLDPKPRIPSLHLLPLPIDSRPIDLHIKHPDPLPSHPRKLLEPYALRQRCLPKVLPRKANLNPQFLQPLHSSQRITGALPLEFEARWARLFAEILDRRVGKPGIPEHGEFEVADIVEMLSRNHVDKGQETIQGVVVEYIVGVKERGSLNISTSPRASAFVEFRSYRIYPHCFTAT